jgi:hypothetical protein
MNNPIGHVSVGNFLKFWANSIKFIVKKQVLGKAVPGLFLLMAILKLAR